MKHHDLQKIINILLNEELSPISSDSLADLDYYLKEGIEKYMDRINTDDYNTLLRLRVALTMLNRFDTPEERNDEDVKDYFCIVCEQKTNNHGDCFSNRGQMRMGYGSRWDTDLVTLTLCDSCLKIKKDKGIIDVDEVI